MHAPRHRQATALHLAALNDRQDVVRVLLAHHGIRVNQPANDGATALCIAGAQGHIRVVRMLLAHDDTDVSHLDDDGGSALHWAGQNGNVEAAAILLRAGCSCALSAADPYIAAAFPEVVRLFGSRIEFWHPSFHTMYAPGLKHAVRALLLVQKRSDGEEWPHRLPIELWILVGTMLASGAWVRPSLQLDPA